jgi:POT family proton-dependent oligopeptide transporter
MGYAVLATYAALVFGFNFFGGVVSDKYLGQRKSIIWGNYLQIAGHLTLAIPLSQTFFPGLALVATGAGFRSSASSSLVGSLYNNNDERRKDDGYSLYYMIFNVGAALGGLICGYLAQNINWHLGFGAACFFMILGQLQFILGVKKSFGLPPEISKLKEKVFLRLLNRETMIYLFSLTVVAGVVVLLEYPGIMNFIMLPLTISAFAYLFVLSLKFRIAERRKLWAAMIMFLIGSLFWACYEQCAGSLNLFVLNNVNLNAAGIKMSGLAINNFAPAAWLVILTPFSIKAWKWLHKKNINSRSYGKYIIAFLAMGSCFLVLWTSCLFNYTTGMIPVAFLVIAYLFMEIGEICLGPVSFSLASKLSPKQIASTTMGLMYLSISFGEYLAGKLGSFMTVPEGISDPVRMMPYFSAVFLKIAFGSLFIALLVAMLSPLLKKWMMEIK